MRSTYWCPGCDRETGLDEEKRHDGQYYWHASYWLRRVRRDREAAVWKRARKLRRIRRVIQWLSEL